jgi:biopolymer transport protein ExbB/TolQ
MSGIVSTFRTFAHGDDPFLVIMLVASVLIVALAMERAVAILRAGRVVGRAEREVLDALRRDDLVEAGRRARLLPSPVREVFVAGLDRAAGTTRGAPRPAVLRAQKRVAAQLRGGLWMLGTSGALMPFVGLLGTVVGVMGSFKAIGETGAGGFQVVSTGISAALIATAAGLFVALEAVVFFNLLQNLAAGVVRELSLLVDEALELLEARGSRAGSTAGE